MVVLYCLAAKCGPCELNNLVLTKLVPETCCRCRRDVVVVCVNSLSEKCRQKTIYSLCIQSRAVYLLIYCKWWDRCFK